MAIYINYANKSLSFYSQDKEQLKQLKAVVDDYLTKQSIENEKTEDEELLETTDNIENVEKTEEIEKNNNLRNFIDTLNHDEDGVVDLKLGFQQNLNSANFSELFSNGEINLPEELINLLKKEKQFLVLPNEIVAFDYALMPTLSFWKIKQALNLKLGIDYKNFEKYGKSYKLLKKTKSNSMFAVQLAKYKNSKQLIDYFSNKGLKIKGINFYSGALANFYASHTRGSKNASIIVKISRTNTTIMAILHGAVVCTETLNCGEKEVYRNSTYKFDEYSRKSIAHKYVCYSVSQMAEGNKENTVSREQIEKAYSKTKTTQMAGNFQSRSLNIIDLIHKKIDDMKMFLLQSEFNTSVENVFVDVKNDEVFAKLKLDDATKVYYPENEILKNQKTNKMFTMNTKFTNKGNLGRKSLWSRKNKKA